MATRKKQQKRKTTKTKDAPKSLTKSLPKDAPEEASGLAEARVVNQLTQTSAQLLGQAELFTVSTQEDALQASRMLVQLSGAVKEVEARRKFFTGPLREHIKRIEALFKPVVERLEKADMLLRQKLLDYQQEVSRRQAEERARLLSEATEAQAGGDTETALALATQASELDTVQRTTHVEEGSVQTRKVWTFEVEDLGKVPMEYLSLDESKVRAAIRAGIREVPGLRIFQKEQLAVSASA